MNLSTLSLQKSPLPDRISVRNSDRCRAGAFGVHRLSGEQPQLLDDLQAAPPVLLLLIDLAQPFQGPPAVQIHLHQVIEQLLGAVEESRTHIVLPQLEEGVTALLPAQVRSRDQVLMDADSPVHISPVPKETTQSQVDLRRLAVHLGELHEDIDSFLSGCPSRR